VKAATTARFKRELPLHLMILPGAILVLIFSYLPMYGIVIAFEKFVPSRGLFGNQLFNGLKNFEYIILMPNFLQVFWNTFFIATMKIIVGFGVTILAALMINEVMNRPLKKTIQTIVYFPYFLSWVIFGGILIDILSPSTGIVNSGLMALGLKQVYFLGDKNVFPWTMIVTDIWKNFGFGTVVYLAAISNIDPTLYEAATIDGANRFQRARFVTIPGISMVIVLIMVLNLGSVLNAGFDQIFNLYNPAVMETGDIIDTLVYRLGLLQSIYGPATAIGLCKSAISFVLIVTSYYLAYKLFDYRLF
jgi:putative aldouronate transport system permease protein